MEKRLLVLLSLILFGVSFSAKAYDFSAFCNGDSIYYNIISNISPRTVEVTFKGANFTTYPYEYEGIVDIPDSVEYNGNYYNVTAIGNSAFYNCIGLTSVTIPNSVTSIDGYAFCNTALTSVIIPNSVSSIGNGAFNRCSGLTSVTIPNSVTSIGYSAFYECSGLTSIIIPTSVTYIGGKAFNNTPWFNSQPDGLIYINNILYYYKGTMPYNTLINITDGTVSISGFAFEWQNQLTSITIPNTVTSIGNSAFFSCLGLYSIIIPNSVTSISNGTFTLCDSLRLITIPNSVTSIGEYAFAGCTSLDSIICESTTPPEVKSSNCFEGINDTIPVYVPCSSISLYQQDSIWSYFTNFVCNPLSVDDIQTNNISTKLYPNPTNSKSYLEIEGLTYEADVLVYDMVGRLIQTHKVNQSTKYLEIDMRGNEKGVYFVRIVNSSIKHTKKLIVQ